ncbi:MAG TPA: hypothetical protein VNL71_03610 [Chloroflexota bacterium]|nr:hypothetical protein [Chloroflexota bacterium]
MMDLVLRAYDHLAVARAETMPVARLLDALNRSELRSPGKRRVGLETEEDIFARETVIERLESLVQENRGEATLVSLRVPPTENPSPIPPQRAAINAEEAVALREDLVRILTYGLWRGPELVVSHVLGIVSGREDTSVLLDDPDSFAELASALEVAQDDEAFAARFGESARASLKAAAKPTDPAAVQRELATCQQVLGPIARLLNGARAVGLRVIAYQDEPGADGLTQFLAHDLAGIGADTASSRPMQASGNGHMA